MQNSSGTTIQQAAAAGDIRRVGRRPGGPGHVNLYLGSGRCGGAFAWHGLHHPVGATRERAGISRTAIMHADHWVRGDYGLDRWLPVYRLFWDPEPQEPGKWFQHQDLYAGVLTTGFETGAGALRIRTAFNPEERDVLTMEIRWTATGGQPPPDILLAPERVICSHYNQEFTVAIAEAFTDGHRAHWVLETPESRTLLCAGAQPESGKINLTLEGARLRLRLSGRRGVCLLRIAAGAASRRAGLTGALEGGDAESSFAGIAGAWGRRWGDAFVRIPDDTVQALWARSIYYILASYAPDVRSPAAPMGWSGNGWPFHFPQDVSYIHPALLRLGHIDIARAIVEYYRSVLEDTRTATRRIYGHPGAMWAWEHPIGNDFGETLLAGGRAPNQYQYEIHNAAYPARMAVETAAHLDDRLWTHDVAWPVVRESARFLASICTRDPEGTWSVSVTPSMGQDEFGGQNARNYLCALFATAYALRAAVRMADRFGFTDSDLARWRAIMSAGFSFVRLLDRRHGIYATAENLVNRDWFGRQKHPVQLNPLIFLPLAEAGSEPTRRAYAMRHKICRDFAEDISYGWTLAAFCLAASHSGDNAGLAADLARIPSMRYADAGGIQIYETSGAVDAPFYVTSHGLLAQAVQDAFVSDYGGRRILRAAVPAGWEETIVQGLRTAAE